MIHALRVWLAHVRFNLLTWKAHYHRRVSGAHFYKALATERQASDAHADLVILETLR